MISHTCSKCSKSLQRLQYCGKCSIVTYCSKECQRADWPTHKLVCTPQLRVDVEAFVTINDIPSSKDNVEEYGLEMFGSIDIARAYFSNKYEMKCQIYAIPLTGKLYRRMLY